MIHLIWIIPAYIAAGFLLATITKADPSDAAWIVLFWPVFIAFCALAGLHEGIRRIMIKVEERNHDNR